jgi:uncharacterized protein (DUF58 family)
LTGWVPTRAYGRAVLLTGVLLTVAALTGRFDLVVLAVPVAVSAALALSRRPLGGPTVGVSIVDPLAIEGGPVTASVSLANPGAVRYDFVLSRLRSPRWVRFHHGDHPYVVHTVPQAVVDIELSGQALRWGRHSIGPLTAHAVAGDGLLISPAVTAPPVRCKVIPATEPFVADEAMPRAAGLVGTHRSRRRGEGGELAGVRMFAAGDRLRRIDWRVTLRTRQLHVAATLSDRDAEVVLLLDVLHEAGWSGGFGGSASVLDTTVRAAAAIAEHYLQRGDRVAVLEYGFRARRLRPGSGRRQYLAVLEWLLDVAPADTPYEPSSGAFGTHLLPATALIVVLTPLLDARSAAMLARLARSGRFVVAVDTLTVTQLSTVDEPWLAVAQRLWALERRNTIGQLREHGVPVVPWAGAGSLDQVLRDVARLAAGPRVRLR